MEKKGSFFQNFAKRLDEPKTAVAMTCIASVLINIIIELLSRKSFISLAKYIFLSPHIFIFNALIIAATFSTIFIFRRRVFGFFIIFLLWMTIGVTDSILLISRTTPFTAQDLRLIQYAWRMIDQYIPIPLLILLIIGILCILIGLGWLYFAAAISRRKFNRFFMICISLSMFFVVVILAKIGNATGIIASRFTNIAQSYHNYGLPYCFSSTLLNTGISKPSDYSDSLIDDIVDRIEHPTDYSKDTIEQESSFVEHSSSEMTEHIKEDPDHTASNTDGAQETEEIPTAPPLLGEGDGTNVIVIQLESFFDVTKMKYMNFDRDPIPYYHQLMNAFPSGYVTVPSIGAGTANTEFEVLTAMNMDNFGPGEYPYKTILNRMTCESIPFIMKNNGYSTHAIHNNDGTFYERHRVFSNLGFDTFTSIEYMYDLTYTETGWAEDKNLIPYIQKALNSTSSRDFIYAISVQGHGAYPEKRVQAFPAVHFYSDNNAIKDKDNEFLYYVNQLYEMDQMIKSLISYLATYSEPVTLVLFGDHLPSFDFSEDDLFECNLYQTPYIIWSNHPSELVDCDLESFQLLPYVLGAEGIRDGYICRLHQNYLATDKSDEILEKYLDDLKTLEFDMLYGDQLVYGGVNPYDPSELKFGLEPIVLHEIVCRKEVMFVLGDHFNQYSTIFVDGKPKDTIFVNDHSLIMISFEPNETQQVCVGQVGVDRVCLSYSNVIEYVYSEDDEVEIVHPTQVDE